MFPQADRWLSANGACVQLRTLDMPRYTVSLANHMGSRTESNHMETETSKPEILVSIHVSLDSEFIVHTPHIQEI